MAISTQSGWRDDIPIYRQIKDKILSAIINGDFKEGEAIPSVRQMAIDLSVNPLTVSKAVSEITDEGLLEKRRGLGMFVTSGSKSSFKAKARENFFKNELPDLLNLRRHQPFLASIDVILYIPCFQRIQPPLCQIKNCSSVLQPDQCPKNNTDY